MPSKPSRNSVKVISRKPSARTNARWPRACITRASTSISARLQLELDAWDDAISNLEIASQDGKLAAGRDARAQSEAQTAKEHYRSAARYLIQALRMVDVGLAMSPDEAGQIGAVYDKLTGGVEDADEQMLKELIARFLKMLTGADWKQRVEKTRLQLEDAIKPGEDAISIALYVDHGIT